MNARVPQKWTTNALDALADEFFHPKSFLPISKVFDDFFKDSGIVSVIEGQSYPKCDMIDKPESTVIEIAIPGLTKENISVEIEDNRLTISGNKQADSQSNEGNRFYRQLHRSAFSRSFILTENHKKNVESINAKFENGILRLEIPKIKEEALKKQKIEIR